MPIDASAATSCAAVTPDPQYTATGPVTPTASNRARSASSGRKVPAAVRLSAVGALSAPGTCPARGSTGSTSPA